MRKYIIVFLAWWIGLHVKAQVEPLLLYKVSQDKACEEWVNSLMSEMTLKEKIGQLFIYTIAPQMTKKNQALLQEVVREYKVGGLLFSAGTLQDQVMLANLAQSYAKVPLMVTFDGEWGLGMRLKNTPSFPRNMVLGCIQDNRLIYEYGKEVGRECKEIGVQVNFAPVADVNINPDNPVINARSFGENPLNVAGKVIAYAAGLESEGVLSVSKHFPGHGDTNVDSHFSLPVLPFSRERLDSVELYPFEQVIKAGLGGMMVGHLQVPVFDPGTELPASLSRNIISGLLTQELQFKGLIFTDALAMKSVSSTRDVCALALKAGNDMVLAPRAIKKELEGVLQAVKKGEIPEESIYMKCRKVLMYKYALGLKRKPHVRLAGLENRVNTPQTQELIHKLRLAAVTVLGNEKRVLPLHTGTAGLAVLSIGKLHADSVFVNGVKKNEAITHYQLDGESRDSLLRLIEQVPGHYKRVIVSVTSQEVGPYAGLLSVLSEKIPVVYVFFTPYRTMALLPQALRPAGAVVLAHSAQRELQAHVADVLFGKVPADGRLSASVGNLYKAGQGITLSTQTPPYYAPEEFGMSSQVLEQISLIAQEGIRGGAFPGCQIVVLKDGKPVYDRCFGKFTYAEEAMKVKPSDLYDLASLTKTTGTLLAVMKLYDKGLFNLTDPVSHYLPFLRGTNKENITIRELLLHESGLPASISLYQALIEKGSYKKPFFKNKKDATHPVQVAEKLYAPADFSYKKEWISSVPTAKYSLQVADGFYIDKSFHEQAMQMIAEVPLKPKKYTYSCINFILLKELVERISGIGLDQFLDREFYQPMRLNRMVFLPLRYFSKEEIAPSVKNDFLRKGIVQGYVHDEMAAFLGGVSGNAGLFSTAGQVAKIYQMLLNGGVFDGRRYLSEETCRHFICTTSDISRRGLGFDRPDMYPHGSPCSVSAPVTVFGHTGFTGTCAWADPDNKLVYVFLSNRTYPQVWNKKLMQMDIRQRIQETIYKSLNDYSK